MYEPKTNTLKSIVNSSYRLGEPTIHVFAAGLNENMIDENGEISNLYGCIIPLGCSNDPKKVEEYVVDMAKMTGHRKFYEVTTGTPVFLEKKTINDNLVKKIILDQDDRLIKIEKGIEEKEKKRIEQEKRYNEEIEKETDDEKDFNNIEFFKRKAWLLVTNQYKIDELQKKIDYYNTINENHKKDLNNHNAVHPEHRKEFLPFFEKKLKSRKEENIFEAFKPRWEEIENNIFS